MAQCAPTQIVAPLAGFPSMSEFDLYKVKLTGVYRRLRSTNLVLLANQGSSHAVTSRSLMEFRAILDEAKPANKMEQMAFELIREIGVCNGFNTRSDELRYMFIMASPVMLTHTLGIQGYVWVELVDGWFRVTENETADKEDAGRAGSRDNRTDSRDGRGSPEQRGQGRYPDRRRLGRWGDSDGLPETGYRMDRRTGGNERPRGPRDGRISPEDHSARPRRDKSKYDKNKRNENKYGDRREGGQERRNDNQDRRGAGQNRRNGRNSRDGANRSNDDPRERKTDSSDSGILPSDLTSRDLPDPTPSVDVPAPQRASEPEGVVSYADILKREEGGHQSWADV